MLKLVQAQSLQLRREAAHLKRWTTLKNKKFKQPQQVRLTCMDDRLQK
jgi:hypothetical protein